MVTIKELKESIRNDLRLDHPQKTLSEAFVATPKKYDLATELLSKKTKIAHEKLYQGYVDAFNKASIRLDTADRAAADNRGSAYRSLKLFEVSNRNATYLHELYFSNISDVQSIVAGDSLAHMRLVRDFSTFENWQDDFIAAGMAAGQGWVISAYDMFLKRYANFCITEHDVNVPVSCFPVIVIDMWEHAYYRDYLDDKEMYLTNMMRELNWEIIERRFEKAEMINKIMELQ